MYIFKSLTIYLKYSFYFIQYFMSEMKRQKYKKGVRVPSFISKLHQMLENRENQHLINWCSNQSSFKIIKPHDFSQNLLSKYFSHRNYASFMRQLNFYNFTKLRLQEEGDNIYHHPLFIRGDFESHKKILRKEVGKVKGSQMQPEESNPIENISEEQEMVSSAKESSMGDFINVQNFLDLSGTIHFPSFEEDYEQKSETNSLINALQKENTLAVTMQNLMLQQQRLKKICNNAINENRLTISHNSDLTQRMKDDPENHSLTLQRISTFMYSFVEENPKFFEMETQKYMFLEVKVLEKILHYLEANYQHDFLFNKSSRLEKIFIQFLKFIESHDVPYILKCLQNLFNSEVKKKRKMYTIVNKYEKIEEEREEFYFAQQNEKLEKKQIDKLFFKHPQYLKCEEKQEKESEVLVKHRKNSKMLKFQWLNQQ